MKVENEIMRGEEKNNRVFHWIIPDIEKCVSVFLKHKRKKIISSELTQD